MPRVHTTPCTLMVLIACCSSGCGPDRTGVPPLAPVAGMVTLDGKPLSGIGVVFTSETGHSSFGKTDANGRYELGFVRGLKGGIIGPSRVWLDGKSGLEHPPGSDFRDPIPPRYGPNGELRAEVVAGPNTIDFSLTTR